MGKGFAAGDGNTERVWQRLVDRCNRDPLFVGWALGSYATDHDLADDQVLLWLECQPDRRDRLALCRVPDPEGTAFASNVRRIAQFVDCNADRLVQLLREVGALGALREGNTSAAGGDLLMAARDRKDVKDPRKGT
jgi:hypothetical protein